MNNIHFVKRHLGVRDWKMDEVVAVLAVAKNSQSEKNDFALGNSWKWSMKANSHNKIRNYLKTRIKFPSPRQLGFKKIKEIGSQKVGLLPSWLPSSPADLSEKS